MTYPKKYDAASAPSEVLAFVHRLVPHLIAGDHPALAALREQFRNATISEIEMTGHGFFATFSTPTETRLAVPADFEGGHAEIVLEGAPSGAGCVLFVRNGRLAFLEGYGFGVEGWPENSRILAVRHVEPMIPERIR
jgi:hypothetical protein